MKSLIYDTLINGSAWAGVVATWMQDIDAWVKLVAGLSAIILSWVTIYFKIKNDSKSK